MKEGELYLSKYRILKVFKETLEGCVLLAEHIQLNSYWIIKKLNSVNDETMREVQVLKGVKHKGIPMIIDVIAEEDSLVIIREYIDGENLNEYSQKGLCQDELVDIGLKLCEILKFLHEGLSRPLIFRDIKPGNIIMTSDGGLKLIDFGIARYYKEDSRYDTTYLGTKGFASPEQYGLSNSDVRTDVFGLGATLYFLTTKSDLGKPPYRLLPISKFRRDIDLSFEKILKKACEINKNKRFQSIHEFELQLIKLVKTEEKLSLEQKISLLDINILGFSGLKNGLGTTYTAMRIAKFLVANHLNVCIIDNSSDESLMSLEFQEETDVKKRSICYQGIDIVSASQLRKESVNSVKKRFQGVHIILIDFGLLKLNKWIKFEKVLESKELFNHIILSKICPWEIDAFEELILSEDIDSKQKIIINSCSKKRFSDIKKTLEDLELFHMPYEPYESLVLEDQFCIQLFDKMEVGISWPKKSSFLNLSHYKTKLLKLIK